MSIQVRRPRIEPVEPPYEPEVEVARGAMMPRNSPVEPLKLFRTLVRHRPLAAAMTALGRFVLGRELSLDLHDRELVIDRVCARCGCKLRRNAACRLTSFSMTVCCVSWRGCGRPRWSARVWCRASAMRN